jgi:hypothetical protein
MSGATRKPQVGDVVVILRPPQGVMMPWSNGTRRLGGALGVVHYVGMDGDLGVQHSERLNDRWWYARNEVAIVGDTR